MAENGYEVRRNEDGSWEVVDLFKNEPAIFEGRLQTGLTETEANETLAELIKQYMERHHEDGSGRLP